MENLKEMKQFTTVQQVMVAYSKELEQFLTFCFCRHLLIYFDEKHVVFIFLDF